MGATKRAVQKLGRDLKVTDTAHANALKPDPNFVRHIIGPMRNRESARTILSDPFMYKFGHAQFVRYFKSNSPHLAAMIRQRLGLICSVFRAHQKYHPEVRFVSELFNPHHYNDFVKAVKDVSGWDEEGVRAPTTATQAGNLCHKVASYLVSIYIVEDVPKQKVDEWIRVYTTSFNDEIGYVARKLRAKVSWEKPKWLPLTDDL